MLALRHRSANAVCYDVQLHAIEGRTHTLFVAFGQLKPEHHTRQNVTKYTSCTHKLAHGELSSRVNDRARTSMINSAHLTYPSLIGEWSCVSTIWPPTIRHPPTSYKTRMCWTILICLQPTVGSVASHNPLFRLNIFLGSNYCDTQPYSKVEHYILKVDPNSVWYCR
jgi:hypothetical protein